MTMKKKTGGISLKEVIFYGFYFVHLLFMCWPGLFFGNSIHPFILGLPFFIFYQYAAVFIIVVVFIVHYYMDHRDGEMEFEVEPGADYLKSEKKAKD